MMRAPQTLEEAQHPFGQMINGLEMDRKCFSASTLGGHGYRPRGHCNNGSRVVAGLTPGGAEVLFVSNVL